MWHGCSQGDLYYKARSVLMYGERVVSELFDGKNCTLLLSTSIVRQIKYRYL